MGSSLSIGQNRVRLLPLLLLLLLLVLATAMWFISTYLTSPAVSTDGAAATEGYSHLLTIYGSGADRLHRPTEVASDSRGNLYVADSFKHRVVVFDADGGFVRTVGGPANVDGALKYPSAIEVDQRGRIYVTSSQPGKVVIFNPDGSILNQFPVEEPLTLAITKDRLYIATSKGILIGDLDGNQVGQLLSAGRGEGQIDRPTGMAVGADGSVYLADSLNYRFQAVDASGKSKWVLGTQPNPEKAVTDRDRQFGLPSGIVLGEDGLLYGIDAFNGEIIVLSTDGQQLGSYGAWGRQDGQFYYPTGIEQVGSERFAVADTFNDRVQIVGVPSPKPSAAIAARRGLPWLIPVALLVPLFLLFRRRPLVVADVEGIRRAFEAGLLPELVKQSRKLYVPEGTVEAATAVVDEYDELTDVLIEVELDEHEEGDQAVAIARALRGRLGLRRVAIALPDRDQEAQAAEYGIGVLGDTPDSTAEPATV